jgi:hypothetical protein
VRSLACLMVMVLPLVASAQAPRPTSPDKDAKPAGAVNWEGQVVQATGSGAPDLRASNPAQARLGAERAAQMDAFRNLLAQVKGIQISAGKTVGDEMATDEIRGKVEGLVRGYRVTDKRYFSDSGVEVDVEVPLSAVTELFVAPSGKALALKKEGEPKNTGLVVDARGLKVSPALSPRLLDAKGAPLYAAEALSDEGRKAGVASYVKGLDPAKKSARVGERPLVVKAERADGSDLVLSAEAVKALTEHNNSYLADGRVVIATE